MVTGLSLFIPKEKVIVVTEPSRWGVSVPVQITLTPIHGTISNIAVADAEDHSVATEQVTTSLRGLKYKGSVINTIVLAGITVICLAILATGIPGVLAALWNTSHQGPV